MERKAVYGIMLTLLLAILMTTPFVRAQPIFFCDTVFIEPEVVQVFVGQYVRINVSYAQGFESFPPPVVEFSLRWNASPLNLVNWEAIWDSPIVVVDDDSMNVSVDNPYENIGLIRIVFEAKAEGDTILDLYDSNVDTEDGYVNIHPRPTLPAVHNINTELNYTIIQEAINAPETLDGHTIRVDAGTYFENVVVNKSISLVGGNKRYTIIDGGWAGNVIYISANNVTITGFTLQNSGFYTGMSGIYLSCSSFNSISHNILKDNKYGMWFDRSKNNSVNDNVIASNHVDGICLGDSSDNNTISDNEVANNLGGIWVTTSNNVISGNHIFLNDIGINVFASIAAEASYNKIVNNNVSSNSHWGIYLGGTFNFVGGNIISLSKDGIQISGSNHIIYDNYVSNNIMPLTSPLAT